VSQQSKKSVDYTDRISKKISEKEMGSGKKDCKLKGNNPRTIQAKFALICFSGLRGKDLNVIFYQNMPNLYNRHNNRY
jgi:hypothetical protein